MTMSETRPFDGASNDERSTDDRRWVRLYAPGVGPDFAIDPALPPLPGSVNASMPLFTPDTVI